MNLIFFISSINRVFAISSAGISLHIPSAGRVDLISLLIKGVSITPGNISETFIPNLFNSAERDSVNPFTACLER